MSSDHIQRCLTMHCESVYLVSLQSGYSLVDHCHSQWESQTTCFVVLYSDLSCLSDLMASKSLGKYFPVEDQVYPCSCQFLLEHNRLIQAFYRTCLPKEVTCLCYTSVQHKEWRTRWGTYLLNFPLASCVRL